MDNLGRLSELIREMINAQQCVNQLEDELKKAKELLAGYVERMIPEAMQQLGMSELKLANGSKLSVKKEYYARISDKKMSEAYNWLAAHGHGSIVKDTVAVTLPAGQSDLVNNVERTLESMGLAVDRRMAVHPSTLKAFVKEQIESGTDIPRDVFGVYETWKTTVK